MSLLSHFEGYIIQIFCDLSAWELLTFYFLMGICVISILFPSLWCWCCWTRWLNDATCYIQQKSKFASYFVNVAHRQFCFYIYFTRTFTRQPPLRRRRRVKKWTVAEVRLQIRNAPRRLITGLEILYSSKTHRIIFHLHLCSSAFVSTCLLLKRILTAFIFTIDLCWPWPLPL